MKVLIVSHTAFSSTESMGKTLSSYFSAFQPDELAQFYIHSQVPTSEVCSHYYRFTDIDAIKSIFSRSYGCSFFCHDVEGSLDLVDGRIDQGFEAKMYQKGRKRSPFIYVARNIWWKLSRWNNIRFRKWLDEICPDCVFFASGDYAFMYTIALKIARYKSIPLFISCMDDYYLYNKDSNSCLGRFQHKLFMKTVRRAMSYASSIFCICDKMAEDYSALFHKKCITIYTPSTIEQPISNEKRSKISYIGSLGNKRDAQLVSIGRMLKEINLQPNHLDVYSTESRPSVLNKLVEENGIVFHGAIKSDEVYRVMGESMAIVHTESFDKKIRKTVKYSVSTKIADSLASGTCIFAFGPEEIASIDYLKKGKAAIVCLSPESLEEKLRTLISDKLGRDQAVKNALVLARNHSVLQTPYIIHNELTCASKV